MYLELLNFLHWMPPNFHFGAPFEPGANCPLCPPPPLNAPTLRECGSPVVPHPCFFWSGTHQNKYSTVSKLWKASCGGLAIHIPFNNAVFSHNSLLLLIYTKDQLKNITYMKKHSIDRLILSQFPIISYTNYSPVIKATVNHIQSFLISNDHSHSR